jgi:tripartite-type tricarboxylate transporter receptor subunit TctC
MTFDPFNSMEMIRAGKLRPLAVLSSRRSPTLPDVPTMDESGILAMNFGSWAALLAPAGTPQPIVERWKAIVKESGYKVDS